MKRAVLIGLGMVSSAYAGALRDLEGKVELTGVLARTSARQLKWLGEHKFDAKSYGGLPAILEDAGIDFAILTTPPDARREIVEALVGEGIPILMEKPVERTLVAATELVGICEHAGVPLGIVLQHRLRPSAVEMRRLIADGGLGRLHAVEIAVPWWRPQAYYDAPGRGSYGRDGGGVMISQAIHTMDLALSLTGPVAEVTAMRATTGFHRMEAEDFMTAGLRFENGAVGTVFATTSAWPGRSESIRLHYDNASVLLESNALTVNWQDGREETVGAAAATGAGADPMAFTHDWHRAVIADFAQALDEGRPPAIPGREALKVHALIDALERSAREGHTTEVTT